VASPTNYSKTQPSLHHMINPRHTYITYAEEWVFRNNQHNPYLYIPRSSWLGLVICHGTIILEVIEKSLPTHAPDSLRHTLDWMNRKKVYSPKLIQWVKTSHHLWSSLYTRIYAEQYLSNAKQDLSNAKQEQNRGNNHTPQQP
jgi:hypothetical protein